MKGFKVAEVASSGNDEFYTPAYAITPLLRHLPPHYLAMAAEHRRMRDFYEMDDLYPERLKLKELGADVEQWQKEVLANEPKTLGKR